MTFSTINIKKKTVFSFVILFSIIFGRSNLFAKNFGSILSPGDLSSSHKQIDGALNCVKCHSFFGGIPNKNCLLCHKKIKERLNKKKGYHWQIKKKCFKCHTDHKGRSFNITGLDKNNFSHNKTGYPLTNKHKKVKCIKCHKKKNTYLDAPTKCNDCHKDIHKGKLGVSCQKCHSTKEWLKLTFKHKKNYKSELNSLGRKIKCITCHKKDDKHKKSLGNKCAKCHYRSNWKKIKFNHDKTSYPLTGKHENLRCKKCHPKIPLKKTRKSYKNCKSIGCHNNRKDRRAHGLQFDSRDCKECHNRSGWKPSTFKHNNIFYEGYKLEGKHNKVSCKKCHQRGKYTPIPYDRCDTLECHGTGKDIKVHNEQFEGRDCSECHTSLEWKPSFFKHDDTGGYNGYKLKGKHINTECIKCHREGKYTPIAFDRCDTTNCHGTGKNANVHEGQFEEIDCAECHNVDGWKPSTFKHEAPSYSGYKLEGRHSSTECEKCHKDGFYKPIPYDRCDNTNCHNLTKTDESHKNDFGGRDCAECHSPRTWRPFVYGHESSGFIPKGAHKLLMCKECHKDKSAYSNVNRDCVTCHKGPHFNQFGPDCRGCHKDLSWLPTTFKHSQVGFRLVGGHRSVGCKECHNNRNYRNISTDCYSCHQETYDKVPYHKTSGYGNTCKDCHTSSFEWSSVRFDHKGRDNNCDQCHLSKFPSNHKTNGYPQDCSLCHKYPTWSFNHRQAGSNCDTCHTRPPTSHTRQGYNTDCSLCHKYPTWNFNHSIVGNDCSNCHNTPNFHTTFGYESDCTICHKYPIWDFDHGTTIFPRNHERTNPNNCNACHPSKNYKNSGGCIECHQVEGKSTHRNGNGNKGCLRAGCHPDGLVP